MVIIIGKQNTVMASLIGMFYWVMTNKSINFKEWLSEIKLEKKKGKTITRFGILDAQIK